MYSFPQFYDGFIHFPVDIVRLPAYSYKYHQSIVKDIHRLMTRQVRLVAIRLQRQAIEQIAESEHLTY